jgi:hypothetical protein
MRSFSAARNPAVEYPECLYPVASVLPEISGLIAMMG